MIEIITAKNEWNLVLDEIGVYDYYSTYDYHMISNTNGETPIMVKYTQGDIVIGLPLLLRTIDNTPYRDATSVYGYAGPISKNISDDFDNTMFRETLFDFFEEQKIVSVFSRLNAFLPHQDTVLRSIGEIKEKGDVVMIDLSQSLEAQRQEYQKRLKSQINRARRLCNVRKAISGDDVAAFINLYYENMERVDAKKYYFFSDDYFYKFTHNDHSEVEIFLASLIETGEVISGAMFLKTNDIMQYHLSGTKTDHMDTGALKLLIDEARIEGTNENYKVLNLGGGLGSREDSLLRFKMSFSKKTKKFSVWQCIANKEVYDELSASSKSEDAEFFPKYRNP
ncbi:MAG TPA: GNAT family N-acetyltransferase [Aquaticitalea sp.]|nr:GNAT family N-acetyltransferase [Aquaticitalea sp.]